MAKVSSGDSKKTEAKTHPDYPGAVGKEWRGKTIWEYNGKELPGYPGTSAFRSEYEYRSKTGSHVPPRPRPQPQPQPQADDLEEWHQRDHMRQDAITYPPRGMSRSAAARYMGIGVRMFDEMVVSRRMPRPRVINDRYVWDRVELDIAFSELPRDRPNFIQELMKRG